MSTYPQSRLTSVVLRWLFRTALVSWRYMWQTTPLHRAEQRGTSAADRPPDLPAGLMDDEVLLADDGVGRLFHRRFRVRIAGATATEDELIAQLAGDFKQFVPSEVVDIEGSRGSERDLTLGDAIVVKMPGPWDGPVGVVHLDATCVRLATLRGHLEAGQVQFRAFRDQEVLTFEVEAWARPSTRLVHLLYSHLRLAKEIQLNMWLRVCLAAARIAGGRPVDGVQIDTRWLVEDQQVQDVQPATTDGAPAMAGP